MTPETIPALFFRQAERFHRKPLYWAKRDGRFQSSTWEEARETVVALSAWLLAREVQPGDRILILSENRPEWGLADLAIQSVGAWTVPIYPSLQEQDILQIAADCRPVIGIASNPEQLQKLRAVKRQVPSLRLLVVMEAGQPGASDERVWSEAVAEGQEASGRLSDQLAAALRRLTADDTATLIYTSGTTGEPKGVMLSHRNFLSNAEACLRVIPIGRKDLHLSFLPLSHVFERMAGWYLMLMAGASVAYAESMDTIPENMLEVRPTVMLGVPRFFEKLYARIQEGLARAPAGKQRVARWALGVGCATSPYRLEHRFAPPWLWIQERLAERLVFHTLQGRLGGRLRFFVSGSAPLSKTIGEFFYSAHVVILEGYGLTETSPVIAVNRPHALRFGTVGLPLPGVEVRFDNDGEILTRGPHVMQGYYQKPDATRAAMVDGWFRTGDIGGMDAEGFLSITDRKKDLIKTAGGKFVAPQKLENLFVTDAYIAQAFLYGDREPYCVALIVPKFPPLFEYAKSRGVAAGSPQELIAAPAIRAFMWERVNALQKDLPSFEQVKAIALLEQEFTQAAGELTPTLKAKRAAIALRYHDVIRGLYQQGTTRPSHSA